MSVVKRNITANAAGSGWGMLVSLTAVPFYIHFLGIEGYGLIGLYISLSAVFSILEFGLPTTINRKLAQLSVQSGSGQQMRDLLRTLEVIAWAIAIAIGLSVALLAPVAATYWIKPQQLSMESAAGTLTMIGMLIACRWPLSLYWGGLMGLQKQVRLNVVVSSFTTVRSVGAVLVLWTIAPSLEALFSWNIAISLVETMVTRFLLWQVLPPSPVGARFSSQQLTASWRFTAGMTAISALTVIWTQLDKLILSAVLSLEAFGYYVLAWQIAAVLYGLLSPVTSALFPRFSQLARDRDERELTRLYHLGCQLTSVLVLPFAAVMALFGQDLLYLWTGNPVVAANGGSILGLLVVGTTVSVLTGFPRTLQFACGWTKLVLYAGTTAMLLAAPLIYFMTVHFGGLGAAWAWLILNCGYMAILLPSMHRRLLKGELRRWLVTDVGAPVLAAFSVAALWKVGFGSPQSYGWMLANLASVTLITALVAVIAAPQVRTLLMQQFLQPGGKADS